MIAAYKQYMFQFAKLLGSTYTDDDLKAQVEQTYQIEKSLAQVLSSF